MLYNIGEQPFIIKDGQRRCWPFSMNEKCVEKYFERIFYEEIKSRQRLRPCAGHGIHMIMVEA